MIPVEVRGVVAGYQGTPVLHGIDLDIPAGELVCLLGPSGCGKTTLLRCLAGFLAPSAGTIRFNGREVTRLPPEQRGIGMVFQHYCLWPHRDVAGNVGFPLEVRGVAARERAPRIAAALERVALPGLGARRVAELSGGQQQRVAIARALVAEPGLLLLDEPLSNLDARLRLELRDEIRRLVREAGLTAICVTHDQAEALAIADRLAVLDQGRLAQVGTPTDCYERPASRTVARFLGDANLLDAAAQRILPESLRRPGLLCLRPERLRCGAGPADRPAWTATVTGTVYEGATTVVDLAIDGTALRLRAAALRPPAVGAALPVWCEPGDLVPVEDR
jgi:ABC-type Fe3+/spermidine/putrescine transport system ATPase subunit